MRVYLVLFDFYGCITKELCFKIRRFALPLKK